MKWRICLAAIRFSALIVLLSSCSYSAPVRSGPSFAKDSFNDPDSDVASSLAVLQRALSLKASLNEIRVLHFVRGTNEFKNELAYVAIEPGNKSVFVQGVLAFCGPKREIRISLAAESSILDWLGPFEQADSTFLPFESDQCKEDEL